MLRVSRVLSDALSRPFVHFPKGDGRGGRDARAPNNDEITLKKISSISDRRGSGAGHPSAPAPGLLPEGTPERRRAAHTGRPSNGSNGGPKSVGRLVARAEARVPVSTNAIFLPFLFSWRTHLLCVRGLLAGGGPCVCVFLSFFRIRLRISSAACIWPALCAERRAGRLVIENGAPISRQMGPQIRIFVGAEASAKYIIIFPFKALHECISFYSFHMFPFKGIVMFGEERRRCARAGPSGGGAFAGVTTDLVRTVARKHNARFSNPLSGDAQSRPQRTLRAEAREPVITSSAPTRRHFLFSEKPRAVRTRGGSGRQAATLRRGRVGPRNPSRRAPATSSRLSQPRWSSRRGRTEAAGRQDGPETENM